MSERSVVGNWQWYHDLICVLRRSPWLPGRGGEFLGDVWEYFGDYWW